jgi:3-hydroxyacyl-CoA dehydrogenase
MLYCMFPITRAGVLGAGTMGARIAAHLANAGIPVLLLDLPGEGPDRNVRSRSGLEQALCGQPAAFFLPGYRERVSPGNFEDDLVRLAECDWIIEAVAENLEIKRGLLARVEAVRKRGAVVSTNTSGLPVRSIAAGFSEDFRRHFLGTHFFNPPRYLHLVEAIPAPDTLPAVTDGVRDFCDRRLGKGVVIARDTPNFIANRIGVFSIGVVLTLMEQQGLSIEEVDALAGPAIGNPKSAIFRTLDIVGLDVHAAVVANLERNLPEDAGRQWLRLPPFFQQMLGRRWLGEKAGQGFYRRERGGEILALDWKTLAYHPRQKVRFASLDVARNVEAPGERLKLLLSAGDRAATFLWAWYSEVFLYAASLVGVIAERVVEIDRSMRWGFGQRLGPFEAWDALGVENTALRLRQEKRAVPESVERMLASGARSFYRIAARDGGSSTQYFDLAARQYRVLEPRPGVLSLKDLKQGGRRIQGNAGASLVDLDEGVLAVEFHSKMNTLGEDQFGALLAGVKETAARFEALVITSEGDDFSAGANLVLVLMAAQGGEWDELELGVRRFQQVNMALKYAPKPVVCAPFGRTLGGGCEILLHGARVQASAELYAGLVESAVGLIPAGGGTKEMLLRATLGTPPEADLLPAIQEAFETIGYAKVSTSAAEAERLKFLRASDGVSMNRERLLAEAKAAALDLARSYQPGSPRTDIRVAGEPGVAALHLSIYLGVQGGFISEHDAVIARKLAHVLCGGRLAADSYVSEQYLLDLEREAFLSLCGERSTQERIQHMLRTGKALRN